MTWDTGKRLDELEQTLYEVSETTYGRDLDTPLEERQQQVAEQMDGYAHEVEQATRYKNVPFSLASVLTAAHKQGLDPRQDSALREKAEEEYETMRERLEYHASDEAFRGDREKAENLRVGMATLAKQFNLPGEKAKEPVRDLIEERLGADYEDPSVSALREAASLAQEFGLEDEYAPTELAERAYEQKMETAEEDRQRSDRMEKYLQAEEIAHEFDLGREKRQQAVKKGLTQLAQPGRYTYTINNVHSRSGRQLFEDMVEKGKEYGLLHDDEVQNAARQTVLDVHDRVQAGQYRHDQLKNAVLIGETFGLEQDEKVDLENIRQEYVRAFIDRDDSDPGFAVEQAVEVGMSDSGVEKVAVDAVQEYVRRGDKDSAQEIAREFLPWNFDDLVIEVMEGPTDEQQD